MSSSLWTLFRNAKPAVTVAATGGRLPTTLPKPQDEFVKPRPRAAALREAVYRARRIAGIAADMVLTPRSGVALGLSASLVFATGAVEGSLLAVSPWQDMDFVVTYAWQQLLPSVVWDTAPPEVVATAMGRDPGLVLHPMPEVPTDMAMATRQLRVQMMRNTRAIVAGFMVIAQVLRGVTATMRAASVYSDRVLSGQEPTYGLLTERVVRLCGLSSDVTLLSIQRYGRHILPVFERLDHMRPMVDRISSQGKVAAVWQVCDNCYGFPNAWHGLWLSEDDFVRTSTGRRVLFMEADATNTEDSLALGKQSMDLNIEDASQAFRQIELKAQQCASKPFRVMRVFLGDLNQRVYTGGGMAYSLRSRIAARREADVMIDAQAPVLDAVLRWCKRACGEERALVFDTSNTEYFSALRGIMQDLGYTIHDTNPLLDTLHQRPSPTMRAATAKREGEAHGEQGGKEHGGKDQGGKEHGGKDQGSKEHGGKEPGGKEPGGKEHGGNDHESKERAGHGQQTKSKLQGAEDAASPTSHKPKSGDDAEHRQETQRQGQQQARATLPRLIYYSTTAETVNAVQALVAAGAADPANTCVLLDKPEGVAALDDLVARSGHQFLALCSAEIYDDLFRQVRAWVRQGHSATEIQEELDARYEVVTEAIKHRIARAAPSAARGAPAITRPAEAVSLTAEALKLSQAPERT